MNYYAVIDTNVLVSALLSDNRYAPTVQVIENLFLGNFVPIFSKEILDEYNEVLRRKKFQFPEDTVAELIHAIELLGETVIPVSKGEVLPDRKDLPFYEVVVDRQDVDAFLVTGNKKHFPEEPFIVTAGEFLDILWGNRLIIQEPDPFYSDDNMDYVIKSVKELRDGKGTPHVLIEVEDE